MYYEIILSSFILMWTVIDPIGTIPVFIALTKNYSAIEKKRIARISSIVALLVLLFFYFLGNTILIRAGVPLAAFQASGGIILFIFALNMILGSSKPEDEIKLIKNETETAIFPLAIPSIAGPGSILTMVILANRKGVTSQDHLIDILVLILVLFANFILMRMSDRVFKVLGNSGAIIISKVMGLILASIAANNVLMGIKAFNILNINP
jgi:multiple antibiotic resistance protein